MGFSFENRFKGPFFAICTLPSDSRWSEYRDEKDNQIFLLPEEKGDRIASYLKVFQGGE